ncbi:MAG: RNA-guided endonuclease TnpB family protein [Gammaproteobacteria bacterium]|nr:RNA-guided endonuclease TnpB family protein [Gammaproteobacteria bacterium]
MLLAHKIELMPSNKQATHFSKACGVSRFAYNWALNEWRIEYEAGGKPTETALRRKLNSIKREQFPWMLEVTKNAPQMAIIQLGQAFKNFFAGHAKYPKFRKKNVRDRFTLTNDQFSVNASRIRIPNLGWVRMRESLRFIGKIISATISRVADKWFVSISVDSEEKFIHTISENQAVVGVDLGVTNFVTLSTGQKISGPKPHQGLLNRLRRLSHSLSRKQKGSNNRHSAKLKLSRLHYRIANIRRDAIHQVTTMLAENFSHVVMEDLNTKGMLKNRCLSRSISDMGFYEFRRQLEYKTNMRNKKLTIADRWFASSKTCSCCGYKLETLALSQREWACPICSTHHDRDTNAAKNLENLAMSSIVTACGASSGGATAHAVASHDVMKQEFSIKVN